MCRLIGALPALEKLTIDGFEWDEDGIPGVDEEPTPRAELYASCGMTTLPALTSLHITCRNFFSNVLLFKAPNLTSLSLGSFRLTYPSSYTLLHLQHLSIHTDRTDQFLHHILLNSPTTLRTLNILFDDGTESLDALGEILTLATGLQSLSTNEGLYLDASGPVFSKYRSASDLRHLSLFSEATPHLVR